MEENNINKQNEKRPEITADRLRDFVKFIIENLVLNKDQVDVSVMEDVPGAFTVNIKVADEDKGRVIGRRGSTINALRGLVRVFGRVLIVLA